MSAVLRRLTLALVTAAALLPGQLHAADGQKVIDGNLEPAGCSQITSLSSAVGLGTIPDGAKLALLQAEADALRWRDDGTSPTSGVGMLLADGDTLVYNGNLRAIEFIETTGSGILNVCMYR